MAHFRASLIFLSLLLTGCSERSADVWMSQIALPCGDKPNCVSTLDKREDFTLSPFVLTPKGMDDWAAIKQAALTLPGAKLADQATHYLHIKATSKVFRFVDDLEIAQTGDHLDVRSASRIGYYDFGVNRKRAEMLRERLIQNGLIVNK
ncbi:DUF1499 domain-containing protein [Photobacterium leiognathi]|uniref:DUF1499 domain-containing protein n=1 Tax=Photobacterium leiognathi TaxID=553611 RepID=UPI00298285A2|nr:DUF1499 domain-containing protein [Photobacterium leiognathi]